MQSAALVGCLIVLAGCASAPEPPPAAEREPEPARPRTRSSLPTLQEYLGSDWELTTPEELVDRYCLESELEGLGTAEDTDVVLSERESRAVPRRAGIEHVGDIGGIERVEAPVRSSGMQRVDRVESVEPIDRVEPSRRTTGRLRVERVGRVEGVERVE